MMERDLGFDDFEDCEIMQIINETLQLCEIVVKNHINFDSILISIIETNQVRWLLLENYSKNLDMSFLPKVRDLRLTDSKGVVELTWITDETQVYNSRESIINDTAVSPDSIPLNFERLISFSVNDFIFQLCRTPNLPPFSEKEIEEVINLKVILSRLLRFTITLNKMKAQDTRRENELSMLFHDVNNKLLTVSGLLHLIEEGENDKFVINSFKENLLSLQTYCGKFKSVMLFDDHIQMVNEEINIKTIIDEVISIYHFNIQNKKQRIKLELQEDSRVNVDPFGIKSVIDNLISNAIKYTPDGGEITIQASIDGKECKITVIDSGLGLSEKDKELVFEKYSPVHQMAAQTERGLGLGLWSSNKIIKKLGGEINVYSEGRGKGSSFEIVFPLE
jgi:signal transduction histidine kinase